MQPGAEKGGMDMDNTPTPERVLEELAAIGFAKATDYLTVKDNVLLLRETETLSPREQAAIATLEQSGGSIKVKFYDKMKALELLGKCMGLFDGKAWEPARENNLLQAILAATQEDLNDLPETEQTAAAGHDLVEPSPVPGL